MNLGESVIYGFISGLTEFLPISSTAHQYVLGTLFGIGTSNPATRLFMHVAALIAVYTSTGNARKHISEARQLQSRRSRKSTKNSKASMEYKVLRNAAIPFLVLFFILYYILPTEINLLLISIFLLINGIVIFMPERMLQGNKNAKVMSRFDSMFTGVIGALSAFPGFSRIGGMVSAATLRGAERKSAVNWAILLSIPALISWILTDVLAIFSGVNVLFWNNFLINFISGVFAFIGSRVGLYVLRNHIRKAGCTTYAYYCWGVALLALILFLTVV